MPATTARRNRRKNMNEWNAKADAKVFFDGEVPCVSYQVMTASGTAKKERVFQTQSEAEAFAAKLNSETMPTNGYERYSASGV